MEKKSFAKQAGEVLGKVAAVWIGLASAVVVLTIPTKALWLFVNWCWNLF